MTTFNPTTWADGFGVWHASVPVTSDPGADFETARKAIFQELWVRGEIHADYPLWITRERYTGHGTAIYKESGK